MKRPLLMTRALLLAFVIISLLSIAFNFWLYALIILIVSVLLYLYFASGSSTDLMVKRDKCQRCNKELKRSVLLNRVYCKQCENKS